MWAIVGSSGFESFDEFEIIEYLPRETPFGLCSNGIQRVLINGIEALFLCRTGREQNLLPCKINYRANIYALKKYGATSIFALSSVRSLRPELKPGDMVIPYQYIDRTKTSRYSTFCDNNLLGYVSLTHPICEGAANEIKKHRKEFDFTTHFSQVYVCIEGPQFPTMVDAHCFQSMGGGVIGMTAFPEYVLAREAGIHYLPCNFIVDYVPWSNKAPNEESVLEIRHKTYAKALKITNWVIKNLADFNDDKNLNMGLAGSLNILPEMLTPDQRAWASVIIGKQKETDRGRQLSTSTATKRYKSKFYQGNKPIPKKLQDFLNFINKYKSSNEEESLQMVRKNEDSLKYYSEKPINIASVRDFSIKVDGQEISVRLYHPNPRKKLPLLIYTHGGGFVSGTLDVFDVPCRAFAHYCNRVVIAVDYRLAPEFVYPAGLDDVYLVAKWAFNHAEELKATAKGFAMAGDSSGANYTALAVGKSKETGDFDVDNQVLLYPTTNMEHNTESMQLFSNGYLLDAKKVDWYRKMYVPKGMDYKDPRVSPLFASNLNNSPRSFIITAGFDPLRDEGILYARALEDASVDVSHYHFDNMIHAFLNFGKLVPLEIKVLYERVADFLN